MQHRDKTKMKKVGVRLCCCDRLLMVNIGNAERYVYFDRHHTKHHFVADRKIIIIK